MLMLCYDNNLISKLKRKLPIKKDNKIIQFNFFKNKKTLERKGNVKRTV